MSIHVSAFTSPLRTTVDHPVTHAPPQTTASNVGDSEYPASNDPLALAPTTVRILKVIFGIVGAMALGAAVVSGIVLNGSLALLGACVAFCMMLFIGMPLILASMGDAAAPH